MEGGTFFHRAKLTKANGSALRLLDLVPGNAVEMLGHEFHFTESDERTKAYFLRKLDMEIEDQPNEDFEAMRSIHEGAQFSTGMGYNATTMLLSSSAAPLLDAGNESSANASFSFNDDPEIILNFIVVDVPLSVVKGVGGKPTATLIPPVLDDRTKRLQLSFNVGTKTIEIRGLKTDFSLRHDPPPKILRRVKLPKNWKEVKLGANPRYFEPHDFVCGKMVDVFGRVMLLLQTADENTAEYYETSCGVKQSTLSMTQRTKVSVVHQIPGFGDGFLPIGNQEDTLSSVYGYIRPHLSIKMAIRNKGKTLKCRATLLPAERGRKHNASLDAVYEITFYLEDDTIRIFVMADRREGGKGSSFLVRGSYLNALPPDANAPRAFVPTDLYLGNVISINGYEMRVVNIDASTSKFCELYPQEFPYFDSYRIVSLMLDKVIYSKLSMFLVGVFSMTNSPYLL